MKKLLLIISIFLVSNELIAQDTLDYQLVDAFRIDKKFSTKVLNYLINKGELTKSEIDERRLNVFNYVYVIDIVNPTYLNDTGIYRFGRLQSHGDMYLLIKTNDQIEIISDLNRDRIIKRVNEFLTENSDDLGDELRDKYRTALDDWLENRSY